MRIRTAMPFLAVLGLLLSGCSGDSGDDPTTLPSLSATPFATASPVPIPSAARVRSPFGAVAFVHYYYAQVNVAFSTANPAALEGLSDPDCGTCESYLEAAARFKSIGQRIRGDSVRIVSAEAPPEENGFEALDVVFDAPARAIVDMAGKLVKSLPAESAYHRTVYLKRVDNGWVLRAVKQES